MESDDVKERKADGTEVKQVIPGRRVELQCVLSQGKPKPQITWNFNEKPIIPNYREYYFANVSFFST